MRRIEYTFNKLKLKFLKNFFIAIGIIWTIIECLSFFIKEFNNFTEENPLILFVSLFISFIYSIIVTIPKQRIHQTTNLSTSVNIELGDLLDKKGNIIIASSNYFDTKTSKTDSLKTQLINRFFNNSVNHLDNLITDSLNMQGINGTQVELQEKPIGKTIKFEIGTTVDISLPFDPKTTVFISVVCEVIYNGRYKSKVSDHRMLLKSLEELWKHIKNTNNNKNIYIPILGAGVTGLSLSKLTLIQLIVFSYLINSKESKIGKSLNIIIPESNYDPELFHEAETFLKTFKI